MKKIIALLVTISLLGSGCAFAETFPISEEPIEVTVWAGITGMQTEWEDMYVWKAYEEMTNVHINWVLFDWQNVNDQIMLMLASGEPLPDAFYKCYVNVSTVSKYGNEGAFLPLNGYIESDMPNYKALLDQYSLWNCYKDANSGSIYSIGMVDAAACNTIGVKMFLNQKWLDNLDLAMPTTLDEFTNVLRAFKTEDANGNGDPNDEIPFTADHIWNLLTLFYGTFNVANRGISNQYINYNEQANDIEFMPISQNWRDMLEYVGMLYQEGLIDQNIFNQDTTSILAMSAEDIIGGIGYYNVSAFIDSSQVTNFKGLNEALEGPYGKSVNNVNAPYMDYNATGFILSEDCKYPNELARWIDYFYSKEGSEFLFWGKENDTFTYDENGKHQWTEWVLNAPGADNYDMLYSRIMPWSGGAMPTITLDDTMSSGEAQGETYNTCVALSPYRLKEIWPSFRYTQEETERLNEILTNMMVHHYDGYMANVIKGVEPITDATWEDYVERFYDLGLGEYLDIVRSGLKRYQEN